MFPTGNFFCQIAQFSLPTFDHPTCPQVAPTMPHSNPPIGVSHFWFILEPILLPPLDFLTTRQNLTMGHFLTGRQLLTIRQPY